MIIESKGIQINKFYLPPFTVNSGEIITCFLYGGAHFQQLQTQLVAIVTGKVVDEKVNIYKPLLFVNHIKCKRFKRPFYPATIKSFFERYGKAGNNMLSKTCDVLSIHPETAINSLKNVELKLMSLNCTLSHTKNIVINLLGIDTKGCEMIFRVLQENADSGGAVILLDNHPDLIDVSNKFVTVELLDR